MGVASQDRDIHNEGIYVMRWGTDIYVIGAVGSVKGRGGYLFLPKRIGREWRWLEFAEWEVRAYWRGHIVWVPTKWKK